MLEDVSGDGSDNDVTQGAEASAAHDDVICAQDLCLPDDDLTSITFFNSRLTIASESCVFLQIDRVFQNFVQLLLVVQMLLFLLFAWLNLQFGRTELYRTG